MAENKSEKTAILESLDEETKENTEPSCLQKCKGLMLSFVWVMGVVISASCVTLLKRQVPDFELNFLRCATVFVLLSVGMLGG